MNSSAASPPETKTLISMNGLLSKTSDDLTHSYDSGRELVALVSNKVSNERPRDAEPPRYRMIPQVRIGGV